MKSTQQLSRSEMEIMEVIWAWGEPVTSTRLLERFANRDWKIQTLATFLTRLVDKGVLRVEKRGRINCYTPALSPMEYRQREARRAVDDLCHGSLPDFLAAFYGDGTIDQTELSALRTWFEKEARRD